MYVSHLVSGQFRLSFCVLLFWIQYIGLLCFLYGFFPIKHPVGGHATEDDYPKIYSDTNQNQSYLGRSRQNIKMYQPNRLVGQLVFMVIDALRADFVYSEQHLTEHGLKFKQNKFDKSNKGRYNGLK